MKTGEYVAELADRVERVLPVPDERTEYPALVVLTGLPGTGKSYVARKLAEKLPFAILQTDAVRKAVFPHPTYEPSESGLVYQVCHELMARLLAQGVRVVFDATNLSESGRRVLYRIADESGAKLAVVRVTASERTACERLRRREAGVDAAALSDADWAVYQKMIASEERIARNHFVVNTDRPIEPALDRIVRAVRQPK